MSQNPQDYLEQGNALLAKGDYQGAIQSYKKALGIKDIDPKLAAQAWYNWGNAL
ncbi:MAG: tetratricopeptide repeat protein [Candidatus Brocadiales bacterium]